MSAKQPETGFRLKRESGEKCAERLSDAMLVAGAQLFL